MLRPHCCGDSHVHEKYLVRKAFAWLATLYEAVNKLSLSTGETGELVRENLGFGLNPGVELAPPRSLISNWRDRAARKNLRNVADTGNGGGGRCRQDNGPVNLGRRQAGSPKVRLYETFSREFRNRIFGWPNRHESEPENQSRFISRLVSISCLASRHLGGCQPPGCPGMDRSGCRTSFG